MARCVVNRKLPSIPFLTASAAAPPPLGRSSASQTGLTLGNAFILLCPFRLLRLSTSPFAAEVSCIWPCRSFALKTGACCDMLVVLEGMFMVEVCCGPLLISLAHVHVMVMMDHHRPIMSYVVRHMYCRALRSPI